MKEGTSRKVDVDILSQLTDASSKYALINPLVWNWVDVVCRRTIPTQRKFVWTPSSSSIYEYPCKRWAKRLHNDPGNLFCDAVLSWLSFWSWSRNTVTQNGGNQGPPERVFHNSLSINGGDNGYKRRPHPSTTELGWGWGLKVAVNPSAVPELRQSHQCEPHQTSQNHIVKMYITVCSKAAGKACCSHERKRWTAEMAPR